eukprot:4794913-Amphidinium_carterae.2
MPSLPRCFKSQDRRPCRLQTVQDSNLQLLEASVGASTCRFFSCLVSSQLLAVMAMYMQYEGLLVLVHWIAVQNIPHWRMLMSDARTC